MLRFTAIRRAVSAGASVLLLLLATLSVVAAPGAQAAATGYTSISVTADGSGYLLVADAGETYAFGTVRYRGNPSGFSGRIVGGAVTADGQGYVEVSSSGQVYAYGTVGYLGNATGSTGIVGVAVTADGHGYVLVSNTGQVYAFGSVRYWGNPSGFTGGIVGIAVTADGQGYVAASGSGQAYAYNLPYRGNAVGSSGIVGVSATADGQGYAMVSNSGQVYAWSEAQYFGNPSGFTGGIVGISLAADGRGYAAVSGIGQVYAYGTVIYRGNGDDGIVGGDLTGAIVAIAQRESKDANHNQEFGGYNCNFYSADLHAGGSGCSNGWRTEQWCADFARWVWGQSGAKTSYLSAAAASFYTYGDKFDTWKAGWSANLAKRGDAVVYKLNADGSHASHVGLVTDVLPDGRITVISGNAGPGTYRVWSETFAPTRSSGISGYTSPIKK